MDSNIRIPEYAHILYERARPDNRVPEQGDNILEELTSLSTDECDFLIDIFQRFPRVQKSFHHFIGIEPEERLTEAVNLLAREPRAGWPVMGVPQGMIQSVAGHQTDGMRLAFMMASGNHDPQRINRIFAVHDLTESVTGDFISGGAYKDPISKPEKQKLERIVLRFLLEEHPSPKNAAEIMALWEEYEAGVTPDSVMAHDIDKLELVMQAQFYESLYPDLKSQFTDLWDHAYQHLQTPQGRNLLLELTAQHPQPHPLKTAHPQGFIFPWPV